MGYTTHYGYKVTTLCDDMRDLSELPSESFDLIWQAPSMCYVPDVRPVYKEVQRLLRSGGLYRVEFENPAVEFVDCEDSYGSGYRINQPYAERERRRADGVQEYRHYLADIFNGLVEAGFRIQLVEESPRCRLSNDDALPGSWEHWLRYMVGFAIVGKKL